jgi:hypothetical protein
MATPIKITQVQAMQDLKITNHQISADFAALMVKKYKRFRRKMIQAKNTDGVCPSNAPDLPLCLTYNKTAIHNLLKTPSCTAIRIYLAINDNGQLTLVMVGVDATGENMLDDKSTSSAKASKAISKATSVALLDEGQASPPYPPPSNGL